MKSNEKIHIKLKGGIDLDKTEKSGQCFRWINDGDGFLIPAFGMLVKAVEAKDGIDLELVSSCKKNTSEDEIRQIWSRYFDASLDYSKIRKMPDEKDKFLTEAARCGEGIRIIYQEAFETLITFIISQRKSIPAIKTSVERICETVGRKIPGSCVYDFPTPDELVKLSPDELSACGLGYRASYIHETAELFARGEMDAEYLSGLDDESLISTLMSLKGVGIKVANCTALFGFHRLDLFPIDVWIQRALDTYYDGAFPLEKYHPYNGIMQQYIFAYRGEL